MSKCIDFVRPIKGFWIRFYLLLICMHITYALLTVKTNLYFVLKEQKDNILVLSLQYYTLENT